MGGMYDHNAPAKLFYWPAEDGSEEEAVYPTLQDAVCAAAEGDLSSAWIITQAGDILNPRMIADMRLDLQPRAPERRSGARALFGW